MASSIATPAIPADGTCPAHPFLTAKWQDLAVLNFEVDPAILAPWIPAGVALDFHDRRTYLSVVGFQFLDARLLGMPAFGYRRFPEVNLRFYVRREVAGRVRRGVVFLKEIAPKRLVACVANRIYHESYAVRRMRCRVERQEVSSSTGGAARRVEYAWRGYRRWNTAALSTKERFQRPEHDSLDEFIIEHYWGYTRLPGGGREYRVEHVPWRIAQADEVAWDVDVQSEYHPARAPFLSREPVSAFLADGSPVAVRQGTSI